MKRESMIFFLALAVLASACAGEGADPDPTTTTSGVTTTVVAPTQPETSTSAPAETTTSNPATTTTSSLIPQTTEPPSTTTTLEPDDGVLSIVVEVANGEVVGGVQTYEAERGWLIEITVTADVADEVHVHAYDEFVDVAPGEAVTLVFTADIPGVFEVELERSGLELLELEVS